MIRILHSVSNMDRAGIETMLMNYYRYMDKSKVQFDFLFSILNRRQFKVYLTNESRIKKVTALLSELQITNRPIKEDFCFDLESMKSEINYEKVYDVIEQNRQSSKQYLKDAIGMAKK